MRIALRHCFTAGAIALLPLSAATPAAAFCGFYVAKADASLFNKASKVVVARQGERTTVTMASDYQGDLKEFALVIPVVWAVVGAIVRTDAEFAVVTAWIDAYVAKVSAAAVSTLSGPPSTP